jgi:hypothetical protein
MSEPARPEPVAYSGSRRPGSPQNLPNPLPSLAVLFSMANSQQTDEFQTERGGSLAKPLAPEEIRVGDFVSPLHVFYDFPSFFWCCDSAIERREETIRIRYLPESAGVPLKVKSICLPFVLVRQANGDRQTLDVRKVRLARLGADYAAAAWKLCKKKNSQANRRL